MMAGSGRSGQNENCLRACGGKRFDGCVGEGGVRIGTGRQGILGAMRRATINGKGRCKGVRLGTGKGGRAARGMGVGKGGDTVGGAGTAGRRDGGVGEGRVQGKVRS